MFKELAEQNVRKFEEWCRKLGGSIECKENTVICTFSRPVGVMVTRVKRGLAITANGFAPLMSIKLEGSGESYAETEVAGLQGVVMLDKGFVRDLAFTPNPLSLDPENPVHHPLDNMLTFKVDAKRVILVSSPFGYTHLTIEGKEEE